MSIFQAAILGIIQGITEFLPISSDGHLVLAQHLLGIKEPPVAFDIILHAATLIVIIIFMWPTIIRLKSVYLKQLIIATIPTGIIGLLINYFIEDLYASLIATAIGFAVTTAFLLASKKNLPQPTNPTTKAVLIGIMQGIAVLPGVSRSGTTISTALMLGMSTSEAFTFSFLAAIPAILGAQVVGLAKISALPPLPLSVYVVGCITAAISGWISIKLLQSVTYHKQFHRFAIYTATIAGFTLLVL